MTLNTAHVIWPLENVIRICAKNVAQVHKFHSWQNINFNSENISLIRAAPNSNFADTLSTKYLLLNAFTCTSTTRGSKSK